MAASDASSSRRLVLILALGLVGVAGCARGGLWALERRMYADASLSPTEWTLYLKKVPGRNVSYRSSAGAPLVPAEVDAYYSTLRVPRAPGPPWGEVPVEIEYDSLLGHRKVTFVHDATKWYADGIWSGYYSSGWQYLALLPSDDGTVKLLMYLETTPCTTVRYSVDSDALDRTLPALPTPMSDLGTRGESIADHPIILPAGTTSVTSCMSGCGGRRSDVRRHFVDSHRRSEPVDGVDCPAH